VSDGCVKVIACAVGLTGTAVTWKLRDTSAAAE